MSELTLMFMFYVVAAMGGYTSVEQPAIGGTLLGLAIAGSVLVAL